MFATNPLGVQLDAIRTEGQDTDYSFDTLWHSEGRLTPEGFIVWIAIPFKSLRFSTDAVQTWGIALVRTVVRNNEFSFWPYITRRVEGFVQQLATLEGLEGISPGRNLQFIPYGIFTRAHFLDTQVPEFRTQTDGRAGLDAKIVLRDALTIDVALNPDFSQVESDEPQVTVNQRFEVFFPEKRPFFIENAGFFQTPENLFFSRRIADPQFGVRLTGKVGRWALGALEIDDRRPGKLVPEGDPLRGDRARIGVLRAQREFAKQSTIGVLVTSRGFASSSNRVVSLDTRIKLSPTWVFTGQWIHSYARALDGTRRSGPTFLADLYHDDRHLYYEIFYIDRSPGFRSELGFIPRVDIRELDNFLAYRWRPKRGRVQAFGPNFFTSVNWDRQGRLQDWRVNLPFAVDFSGNTHLFVRHSEYFERFQEIGFRERSNDVIFSTEWLKWLSISANIIRGKGVNFFSAPGLAPFSANFLNGQFGFTVRPSPHVRFDHTYIYSRLATREGSTPTGLSARPSIFNNHILRSKLNYQFSRELSLRAILDYNAVLPNPQLVALDRSKRLTADFLLTYLLHPGTALYLGYTDRYENLALDPGMPPSQPPSLRFIGSPTTSTGRQFFAKISYLFRF